MSKEKKLGQETAFPCEEFGYVNEDKPYNLIHSHIGMSKRFYAACVIMAGICADTSVKLDDRSITENVKITYKVVDEILKQEDE